MFPCRILLHRRAYKQDLSPSWINSCRKTIAPLCRSVLRFKQWITQPICTSDAAYSCCNNANYYSQYIWFFQRMSHSTFCMTYNWIRFYKSTMQVSCCTRAYTYKVNLNIFIAYTLRTTVSEVNVNLARKLIWQIMTIVIHQRQCIQQKFGTLWMLSLTARSAFRLPIYQFVVNRSRQTSMYLVG